MSTPTHFVLFALVLFAYLTHCATYSVVVNCSQNRRTISPLIYGLNKATVEQMTTYRIPLSRWGGNAVTSYNYINDIGSRGADWFYEKIIVSNVIPVNASEAKRNSAANVFLGGVKSAGAYSYFTVPLIGWVPANSTTNYGKPYPCSSPRSLNPNQTAFDPYQNQTHCGSGKLNATHPVPQFLPPSNHSVPIDHIWVKNWVSYIVQRFGPSNKTRIYQLDNEPSLWSTNHRDLRSTPLSYDELWRRMRDYAYAILQVDPTALIAGPNEWGWTSFRCSDLDTSLSSTCSMNSPDRKNHSGLEVVAWILQQANNFQQTNGTRILHILDLHYYPRGTYSYDNATRSYWDRNYVDPSWINEPVYIIPRMLDWVNFYYPNTSISISEYNFEGDQNVTGANNNNKFGTLMYADGLGVFGREGLWAAMVWESPKVNDASFAAFRLFRNYNGAGGSFQSTSVAVTPSINGKVKLYASVGSNLLTIVIVNFDSVANNVSVTVGGGFNLSATTTNALFYRTNPSVVNSSALLAGINVSRIGSKMYNVTLAAYQAGLLAIVGTDTGVTPPPPSVPKCYLYTSGPNPIYPYDNYGWGFTNTAKGIKISNLTSSNGIKITCLNPTTTNCIGLSPSATIFFDVQSFNNASYPVFVGYYQNNVFNPIEVTNFQKTYAVNVSSLGITSRTYVSAILIETGSSPVLFGDLYFTNIAVSNCGQVAAALAPVETVYNEQNFTLPYNEQNFTLSNSNGQETKSWLLPTGITLFVVVIGVVCTAVAIKYRQNHMELV